MDNLKEPNFLQILSPLLVSLRLLGLCPLKPVFSNGRFGLGFTWTSVRMLQLYFNLVIMITYVFYMLYQIFDWKNSNQQLSLSVIEIGSALYGTLFPIGMLCLIVAKRKHLIQFYIQMNSLRAHLGQSINMNYVRLMTWRLFILYFAMSFILAIFEGLHIWNNPQQSYSVLYHFPNAGFNWKILGVVLHFYLFLLKSYCCAYTEIVCSTMALSFMKSIKNIQIEYLDPFKFVIFEGQLENADSARSNNVSVLSFITSEIIPNKLELELEDQKYLEKCRIVSNGINETKNECNKKSMHSEFSETSTVLSGLKRFQVVATMQTLMNNLFGSILTLNVTLMVFLTCVNAFCQVRHIQLAEELSSFRTAIEVYTIMLHSIFIAVRLVIIFCMLGNVHNAAINFNLALSSALVNLKGGKTVEMNTILAYLTINAINPVSFSAGGYFSFSRSSLLTAGSIIITYLVLLLQF